MNLRAFQGNQAAIPHAEGDRYVQVCAPRFGIDTAVQRDRESALTQVDPGIPALVRVEDIHRLLGGDRTAVMRLAMSPDADDPFNFVSRN
ncbi:hypothetical protein A5751_22935 [Mycolicibacterium fortuitum]|nr:hypothetical protein A5751_22935 [Mycolicibacterium fortuitum]